MEVIWKKQWKKIHFLPKYWFYRWKNIFLAGTRIFWCCVFIVWCFDIFFYRNAWRTGAGTQWGGGGSARSCCWRWTTAAPPGGSATGAPGPGARWSSGSVSHACRIVFLIFFLLFLSYFLLLFSYFLLFFSYFLFTASTVHHLICNWFFSYFYFTASTVKIWC